MRAGELRHWLAIQKPTITVSTSGNRTEAWAMFAEFWGSVSTGSGREFWQAKQVISDLTHSITLRYVSGVTDAMRVKFVDPKTNAIRYFNIRNVLNADERTEMLSIMATEVKS